MPEQAEESSALGWAVSTLKWKVVELWTLSADELLAAPNVGVTLWAVLAQYEGPPEVLLQRCRDRIDRDGGPQTPNLLAVAQVFAKLHFDKPEWLDILGGKNMLIETPLIQELKAEFEQAACVKTLLRVLEARFGSVTPMVTAGLAQVKEEEKLLRLTHHAAVCPSLPVFEEALCQELPAPAPPSTRGKRRSRKPAPE